MTCLLYILYCCVQNILFKFIFNTFRLRRLIYYSIFPFSFPVSISHRPLSLPFWLSSLSPPLALPQSISIIIFSFQYLYLSHTWYFLFIHKIQEKGLIFVTQEIIKLILVFFGSNKHRFLYFKNFFSGLIWRMILCPCYLLGTPSPYRYLYLLVRDILRHD